MKNEILDDIFKDDFRDLIKKDEKVIWEGRPAITSYTKWSTIIGAIIILFTIFSFMKRGLNIIDFIFPISFGTWVLLRLWQSQKYRYLITDQRVLFQLWEKPNSKFWQQQKKVFKEIPLDQIKNISVRKDEKNNGAILIQTKTKEFHFDSINLKNGDNRCKPSLEMIDDVEKVAEYIQTSIQKRLE